ncbi:MAG: hypothetical protein AUI15_12990 [Actinobacteria bacterium 13_2_20CM_2_66_6]|nr:MAG: hypothetical protein AUI15_12990 [Actinobacteria bacterium 13_2_20CM_2_66_6]
MRATVPAGSSSTSRAPRAPIENVHGASRSAMRTTRRARSTKTASIGKRMNHMVMSAVFVMSRPSPSSRRDRGIRPKARAKKLSAMSQRVARSTSRVRLRMRCGADDPR